ncbi:MAG TPA: MtrB/PioB family outer membrane beta-barrel protein [Vicinamibacterales bacterium]|nr:MtrB/PioB family outer membrane beta-barrel protein [Vicinamibacterales bacterium]
MRTTATYVALVTTLCLAAPRAGAQTSTVEVGPGAVSDASYKAGEYNGLQNQGAFGIGNIDLRGGNSGYNTDTTRRWRIRGNDLGLDSRSLIGEIGEQGKFRLVGAYDELRRNRSDTFQTPYVGTGTNTLTLPGTWVVPAVAGVNGTNTAGMVVSARGLVPSIAAAPYINSLATSPTFGAIVTPTASQIGAITAAAASDNPLFHNYDLYTRRQSVSAAFSYSFDPRWSLDGSVRPEHKDGAKPMGTVSRNTGADISTPIADLIDQNHTQTSVNLHFTNDRGFAQASYYGSYFRNNVPFMQWQNWASPAGTMNTISSAPGNDFSQVNATAGLTITKTTRLVANGAYGRATQNDHFLTDATTPVVPVNSLNGLVVTSAFGAKLTSKASKSLNLSLGYRFDERDNQTAIHVFQYADAGDTPVANANFPAGPANPLGAVLAQNANANRPYSRELNQVTGEADYALPRHQWLKAGYTFERIDRWCTGSWIDCADAAVTNEQTLRAEWRTSVAGSVTARVNYAYAARRDPTYNENAYLALVPYANVVPATATNGMSAYGFMVANGWTGWGPAAGYAATTGNMNLFFPNNNAMANALYANNNRVSELPGLRRDYVADRNRNLLRSLLTYQASDALSLQGGVDVTGDDYPTSVYGVQSAKAWAVNVDAGYALAADFTLDVFYSLEDGRTISAGDSYTANSSAATVAGAQPTAIGLAGNTCDTFTTLQQRNVNNKLDPCLPWSATMTDLVHTAGLGVRKQIDRLDLAGHVIYSRARWDNAVAGGNWQNNLLLGPGAAPTTVAAFFIAATPVPTVSTDTGEVRITGTYAVTPAQGLRLSYAYTRLRSNDLAYEGMQFGSVNAAVPTNEQPFSYSISAFGVSYVVSF